MSGPSPAHDADIAAQLGNTEAVPRVSVCIPAYRQPEIFRRALESVLSQAGVSFEVVVTDDTPDDEIRQVVVHCDPSGRVRYHHNPSRLGSPENWNEAVRRARGEYVKLLHHDDYLTATDSLSKYVALLDRHPEADLGFSESQVWMVASGERWVHRPAPARLRMLASRPGTLFAGNLIGSPSAVIYRRGVRETFDPKLMWLVDVDFYLRVLAARPAVAFHPEPLVCTSNGAWQVTAQVGDDPAVDLFEHLHVYNRISRSGTSAFLMTWARLFAKYGITSLDDLRRYAGGEPIPAGRLTPALWLGRLVAGRDRARRWKAALAPGTRTGERTRG